MITPPFRPVLLAFGIWLLAWHASAQSPPPTSPDEFARLLQAHYNTVHDFTSEFVQQYRGGAVRQLVAERGQVKIKKPGGMDFTYNSAEKKEWVADGEKMYT